MSDTSEQGTGKHPHKSTEEPWHHTEGSGSGQRSESSSEHSGSEHDRRQSASGTSEGDEHGNVHHHTHTAEAMDERKAS